LEISSEQSCSFFEQFCSAGHLPGFGQILPGFGQFQIVMNCCGRSAKKAAAKVVNAAGLAALR
jgi:hypothetical protein